MPCMPNATLCIYDYYAQLYMMTKDDQFLQVYNCLQKLMVSFSHGGTIKLIEAMSESFDEDVLTWSAGQEQHLKV